MACKNHMIFVAAFHNHPLKLIFTGNSLNESHVKMNIMLLIFFNCKKEPSQRKQYFRFLYACIEAKFYWLSLM